MQIQLVHLLYSTLLTWGMRYSSSGRGRLRCSEDVSLTTRLFRYLVNSGSSNPDAFPKVMRDPNMMARFRASDDMQLSCKCDTKIINKDF